MKSKIAKIHRIFNKTCTHLSLVHQSRRSPAGIYLLKFNNRNIRIRCEICSKLTIDTRTTTMALLFLILVSSPSVSIVNFEQHVIADRGHTKLTHFCRIFPFHTPWKYQKTEVSLMSPWGTKWVYWPRIGEESKQKKLGSLMHFFRIRNEILDIKKRKITWLAQYSQ